MNLRRTQKPAGLFFVLIKVNISEELYMSLFGGVISVQGITFLMFSVFCIAAVGYALGRITIKGIDLGTAGVFVISLVYGILFSNNADR